MPWKILVPFASVTRCLRFRSIISASGKSGRPFKSLVGLSTRSGRKRWSKLQKWSWLPECGVAVRKIVFLASSSHGGPWQVRTSERSAS